MILKIYALIAALFYCYNQSIASNILKCEIIDNPIIEGDTSIKIHSAKPLLTKPNVLVIYLDDCRYDVFGANGGPQFFNSPAINSIANEGANFRWCFPALSLCGPSRASIVSGLYPHHHGVYNNAILETFPHTTLAEIMHDNGYFTGYIGKYGFQKFPVPGYDYYCQSSSDDYLDAGYQYNSPNFQVISGHKTEVLTDKTFEFLSQVPAGQKFFLFLAHKAPHVPYDPRPVDEGIFNDDTMPFPANFPGYTANAPSHYVDCNATYQTPDDVSENYRDYFELLQGAEWSVDTILNYLSTNNLLDSTLIIFTSDNGLLIGEHQLSGKELILDPSIRLPMFIRYPLWFSPNTVITTEMAMNIDIAPTVLDAAGITNTFNFDGVSMHSLASGAVHRQELFYEYFFRDGCNPTFQGIRDFSYKYVTNQCSTTVGEFYNLVLDSLETYNLINDPTYASLISLYEIKLDSLKNYYGYVNLSDTTLDCFLYNPDSSVYTFTYPIPDAFGNYTLQAYPNPVNNIITVAVNSQKKGMADLVVRNIYSQILFHHKFSLSTDSSFTNVNVASYPAGTYVIELTVNGKTQSLRFIKE
ncbi:MAG: sulfatase-like hydrolase/transferase [Chitinophagales bacterium]|nr:sulfatase-like hydrolase/transferase [Chitinophagales bacterium]